MTAFINSFRSEWLKKKRSLASWLIIAGAFFTPTIITLARIKNSHTLPALYQREDFWTRLWIASWESMAVLLLPMGIILATGLITQIEFKNNAWKQLHATPQEYHTIFFAKLAVIFVMLVEVFILFNLGIYLSALIPYLLFSGVSYPVAAIPYELFLEQNLKFFVASLPVLALQYLISLQYKNFLVPIGVGFVIWVLGLGTISWEHNYIFPYILSGLEHLKASGQSTRQFPIDIQLLAVCYTTVFIVAGYILYRMKREKG